MPAHLAFQRDRLVSTEGDTRFTQSPFHSEQPCRALCGACQVPSALWPLVHSCSWELDVWVDRDDPLVSLATQLSGPWPSYPPGTPCYCRQVGCPRCVPVQATLAGPLRSGLRHLSSLRLGESSL